MHSGAVRFGKKTVLQQLISRYADVDVIIVAGLRGAGR